MVASHRLPAQLRSEGGTLRIEASAGGLVTALAPVLEGAGGTWIGCPGPTAEDCEGVDLDAAMHRMGEECGCRCRAVVYPERDLDEFYRGFSNEIVWPLFHDLVTRCRFESSYWTAYRRVNRQFADEVGAVSRGSVVWVHDYHLMRLATELRHRASEATLAFFLHIPFPGPDILAKLPWRREVLVSLADFDLCGFQTIHDMENFMSAVETFLPAATVDRSEHCPRLLHGTRVTRLGAFPVGIDVDEFEALAGSPAVEARVREIRALHGGGKILLGVDRLDYTKGIPERLEALDQLLETRPELRGEVVFHQQLVPSREAIPEYANLRREIEELIGKINGRYTTPGWTPVSYCYGSVRRPELVALYRAADVALVTPLRDGMNLVSLEFCASRADDRGVLVLSEFAGAAETLGDDAILVNPFDRAGTCAALAEALELPPDAVESRMKRLRERVRGQTARAWAEEFLAAIGDAAAGVEARPTVGRA